MRNKNLPLPKLTSEQRLMFLRYVSIGEKHECWPIKRSTKTNPYGVVSINGIFYAASRVMYSDYYEKDPGPKLVCHTCDNPPCCNPNHMFLGTDKTNSDDKIKKGRFNHYLTKLKPDQVRQIKEQLTLGVSVTTLSKIYGISKGAIRGIKSGRNWKNIT